MDIAIRTVNLTTEIPPDREVRIKLPPGPAEIVVIVTRRTPTPTHTLGELARSEFFGMWFDRTDIGDSVEFARRLRAKAWRQPP